MSKQDFMFRHKNRDYGLVHELFTQGGLESLSLYPGERREGLHLGKDRDLKNCISGCAASCPTG